MENNTVYNIRQGVVFSHVCDVPVLAVTRDTFDETDVAACVLNDSGEFIWGCVGKGQTLQEIVRDVSAHYEEEEETVREGVESFLKTLQKQHFIEKDT